MNNLVEKCVQFLNKTYQGYFHQETENSNENSAVPPYAIPPADGTCALTSLPTELVVEILSKLDEKSLAKSCRLNKQINLIIKSEGLSLIFIKQQWIVFENLCLKKHLYREHCTSERIEAFFDFFLSYAYSGITIKSNKTFLYIQEKIHEFIKQVIDETSEGASAAFPTLSIEIASELHEQQIQYRRNLFMEKTIAFLDKQKNLSDLLNIQQFLSCIPFSYLPFTVLNDPEHQHPVVIKLALLNEIETRFTSKTVSTDEITEDFIPLLLQAMEKNSNEVTGLLDEHCSTEMFLFLGKGMEMYAEANDRPFPWTYDEYQRRINQKRITRSS